MNSFLLKNKFVLIIFISLSLLPALIWFQGHSSIYANETETKLTIGDLQPGDRIVDPSWNWEHKTGADYTGKGEIKPVTWIVVSRNHYGIKTGITLLSEELIGSYVFDNSTDRNDIDDKSMTGWNSGHNHWGKSGTTDASKGLRIWLNDYFYNAFSQNFKNSLVTINLPNSDWKDGKSYITRDSVFIPSTTELGDKDHSWTYTTGRAFPYFSDQPDEKRKARLGEDFFYYWTRSPHADYSYHLRTVGPDGGLNNFYQADRGIHGVRPVVCISNGIPVVKATGDNTYLIYWESDNIDASVIPSKTGYAIGFSENIQIRLNPGSRNLLKISDDKNDLIKNVHYDVTNNVYTFLPSYLEKRGTGSIKITFKMDAGVNPVANITIVDIANNHQPLKNLDIGDRVTDLSWSWEHRSGPDYTYVGGDPYKSITWILTAKDHYGANSGFTLLSEKIIGRSTFDNTADLHAWGSNHWGSSNIIRQWLQYGFYESFSDRFRESVLLTKVPVKGNRINFDGNDYFTYDRVFLPSEKELNGGGDNASADESVWPFFKNAQREDLKALLNEEYAPYWTRTPYITDPNLLKHVHTTGQLNYSSPYNSYRGIRPALNKDPTAQISVTTNNNGVYEFVYPSRLTSIAEPDKYLTITPGESKRFIVTIKDQFGNPFPLSKGRAFIGLPENIPLEDFTWIESVNYDYDFGKNNQALITVKGEKNVTGSNNNITICAYGVCMVDGFKLENGYSGFLLEPPGEKTAGSPFTISLTNAKNINGKIIDGLYDSTITISHVADLYSRTIYEKIKFVDGEASYGLNLRIAGEYLITISINGINDPQTTGTFTVKPTIPDTVNISPNYSVEITAGEKLIFEIEARDRFNNLITNNPEDFIWINCKNGVFEETFSGIYHISAQIGDITTDPVSINVKPGDPDKSQSIIEPHELPLLENGRDYPIMLTLNDKYGNPVTAGRSWGETKTEFVRKDNTSLENSLFIEEIKRDYSYGDANQLLITVTTHENITGAVDDMIIKAGNSVLKENLSVKVKGYDIVSPANIEYILNSEKDITVKMSKDTGKLLSVSEGSTAIREGTDYIVKNNNCIIKENYLRKFEKGKINLVFNFESTGGLKPNTEISFINGIDVLPASITYFPNTGQKVDVYLNNLNGRKVNKVKYGAETLEEGSDFISKDDYFNFSTELLDKQKPGEMKLIFETGDDIIKPEVTIIIFGENATLTPPKNLYIPYSSQEITFSIDLKGKKFMNILADGTPLTNNLDYTISGKSIHLTPFFLDKQAPGKEILLTFVTDTGKSPSGLLIISFQAGDVIGSGTITVADAILVLRHIVGTTNLENIDEYDNLALQRALVTGNKKPSIKDAIMILRKVVGLIETFPS